MRLALHRSFRQIKVKRLRVEKTDFGMVIFGDLCHALGMLSSNPSLMGVVQRDPLKSSEVCFMPLWDAEPVPAWHLRKLSWLMRTVTPTHYRIVKRMLLWWDSLAAGTLGQGMIACLMGLGSRGRELEGGLLGPSALAKCHQPCLKNKNSRVSSYHLEQPGLYHSYSSKAFCKIKI